MTLQILFPHLKANRGL